MDGLGVGVGSQSIPSDAVAAPPTWQTNCARVRAAAARLQRDHAFMDTVSFDSLVDELLTLLDDAEPLVAFLALELLRDALGNISDAPTVKGCVRRILQTPAASDAARRFQLLRQLIRATKPGGNMQANETSSDSSDDDETEEEREDGFAARRLYLESVVGNMVSYGALLSVAMQDPTSGCDTVHEGLVCLADIVKRSAGIAHEEKVGDLQRLVQRSLELSATWRFGHGAVPTFVACDIIDLVVGARALYPQIASSTWVATALTTLQSPLSRFAMALLQDDSTSSDDACAGSFVAMSTPYPLVQKWIQLCCITANNVLHAPSVFPGPPLADMDPPFHVGTLPTRAQLFTVLTEQDDILVDVAMELLAIAQQLENPNSAVPTEWIAYFESELSPDLIFAQLLQVFSDDHLVLLDMIMSSETRMLEYLLQYVRYTTTSWPRSRIAWDGINRTRSVMATLIRLRMEIERLVDAGVFPYTPAPLLRRLENLENQYENEPS